MKNIYKYMEYIISNNNMIKLFFFSLIITVIIFIIKKILTRTLNIIKNNKKKYYIKNKINIVFTSIYIIVLFILWFPYLKNIITFISLFTAAVAIALREILFNIFCGLFIKIKKPFLVEDRIEIDDIRGDVVNINLMNFEVLEVNEKLNYTGQSTGIIVVVPNSTLFHKPLKNYNKAFKYIWDEMKIKIKIGSDLNTAKELIYRILNENDTIREIPRKMKKKIENIDSNYRIYYNNYNPIIYTKLEDEYIELTVRFLIHPKKARYVESFVWERLLFLYNNKELSLFLEKGEDENE